MLAWLTYRRARIERIDAEAEALIHDFGGAAYSEARLVLAGYLTESHNPYEAANARTKFHGGALF